MANLTSASLNAIFEPRGSTTKRANVGLQIGGVDISNTYMQYSEGAGTSTAAVTNLQSGGSDINTMFAVLGDVGSPLPDITWAGNPAVTYSKNGVNSATASITINNDGSTTRNGTGTLAGNWLDSVASGNGDDFEVRHTNSVGATISGFTSWTAITSNRTFSLTGAVDRSASFDIEIRPVGGSAEARPITLNVTIAGGGILQ